MAETAESIVVDLLLSGGYKAIPIVEDVAAAEAGDQEAFTRFLDRARKADTAQIFYLAFLVNSLCGLLGEPTAEVLASCRTFLAELAERQAS